MLAIMQRKKKMGTSHERRAFYLCIRTLLRNFCFFVQLDHLNGHFSHACENINCMENDNDCNVRYAVYYESQNG